MSLHANNYAIVAHVLQMFNAHEHAAVAFVAAEQVRYKDVPLSQDEIGALLAAAGLTCIGLYTHQRGVPQEMLDMLRAGFVVMAELRDTPEYKGPVWGIVGLGAAPSTLDIRVADDDCADDTTAALTDNLTGDYIVIFERAQKADPRHN